MKEVRRTVVSNKIVDSNGSLINLYFLDCGHTTSTCQWFEYPSVRGKLNAEALCYPCMKVILKEMGGTQ
jgi:hypothetical protein